MPSLTLVGSSTGRLWSVGPALVPNIPDVIEERTDDRRHTGKIAQGDERVDVKCGLAVLMGGDDMLFAESRNVLPCGICGLLGIL